MENKEKCFAKILGRMDFKEKEDKQYNRNFTAKLMESAAFSYGNKTCVVIEWGEMQNGRTPEDTLIDTRYDLRIRRDGSNFAEWLETWFKSNFKLHNLIFI